MIALETRVRRLEGGPLADEPQHFWVSWIYDDETPGEAWLVEFGHARPQATDPIARVHLHGHKRPYELNDHAGADHERT